MREHGGQRRQWARPITGGTTFRDMYGLRFFFPASTIDFISYFLFIIYFSLGYFNPIWTFSSFKLGHGYKTRILVQFVYLGVFKLKVIPHYK